MGRQRCGARSCGGEEQETKGGCAYQATATA
jgi:hypothetical protein